jgi:2'-5' RNA ligase
MRYSIWIIPPEPIYSELKDTIDDLAKKYGGPTFEPHMTLLGDIDRILTEIESKIRKLVADLDNLKLSLGPVSFSTTYFQSVLVRVNSTAKLMQLNLDAKKLLDIDNNVFMPHLSLLYGDHDMVTREKAMSNLQFSQASFIVDKLIITPATPNPTEWLHSATISFGENP